MQVNRAGHRFRLLVPPAAFAATPAFMLRGMFSARWRLHEDAKRTNQRCRRTISSHAALKIQW